MSALPAVPARPPRIRRRAVRRVVGTLTAVSGALALTACGGGSAGGAAPTTSAESSTSPSASPTSTATRISLGDVASVVVPAGWSHEERSGGTANIDTPFDTVCLDDPSVTAADGSCDLTISWGAVVAGAEGKPWVVHQVAGWNHATDAPPCPVPGSTTDGTAADYGVTRMSDAPEQGFAKLGAKTAYLDTYTATCGDGQTFHPRVWWLPTTHLQVVDVLDNPQTPAVLASMRFTGTSAAPSASATSAKAGTVHGYLTALTGRTLTIGVVRTYGNDAAGKAYAAAHGIAYPFDNDYLDVPTGAAFSAPLASSAVCRGGVRVAGTEPLSPKTVPCTQFGTYVAATGPVLVDATVAPGGTVTALVEVYRP